MFFHNFKYELLSSIRVKSLIIWLILFPMLLGTLFKITFDGIYEKDVEFSTIPVAIVENSEDMIFDMIIKNVSSGDDALLKAEFTSEEEAVEMLKKHKIKGIIYRDDKLSLTVAEKGIEQTILKYFIEEYNLQESVIKDSIKNDISNADKVISAFSEDISPIEKIPLTNGSTDVYLSYFYNLIAMVAMFGTITGLHIAQLNQANLSTIGARNNCSPTPKSVKIISGLLGSYITQGICTTTCITFIRFVLKVNLGENLVFVYLAAFLGGITGVSMGFCIGSIGTIGENAKIGITMSVSMISCFLSGLMVGNLKAIVAQNIPWLNNINPASVICDSIFCLNIYSDFEKFTEKSITMLIISAIFVTIGIIMTRRRKYASL